ncbi:pullulanase-type alpha-1,6-glucosidase [Marinobacter sp. HL-58]|uniref:pullulanase-type alpha-1,6-glucosidase n=1 Tax=Marinobacter sp. HL-58 TaxID=1479237 RepID=UPI0004819A6D|nr:pullulanase-type alpha-1,6-glucosidase [Marinobacter sp. HL-58]KPP99018.1 MAG: pullulanase-type alpha-1,6-glucosidase [Marinobacter sp. HL-58]
MPDHKLVAGGWVLALSLALTGCNSGSSSSSPDNDDAGSEDSTTLLEPGENEAILYYKRPEGDYDGWGLHLWNDAAAGCDGLAEDVPTEWSDPRSHDGVNDTYGAYYIIPMRDGGDCMNFIMHKGDEKDLGDDDHRWHFDALGNRIFTLSGSELLSPDPIESEEMTIDGARAHWLDAGTLVFADTADAARVELRYDANAGISVDDANNTLEGGKTIELSATTLSPELEQAFPHLAGWPAYSVDADTQTREEALRGQLVAGAFNSDDELISATRLQIPGVLDQLYTYDGALGATVNGADTDFKVWAPTAQNMRLHVFNADGSTVTGFPVDMTRNDGVWQHTANTAEVDRKFYQYEVTVYHPRTDAIETTMTSDPYARSLSENGQYAQVVNLADSDLKPADWDSLATPPMQAPEDVVVYEAHIRDFSATDETVTAENRGKYAAFTETSTDGMKHLASMADAGITHLHLLPAFDIATVNEDPDQIVNIDDDFSRLCDLSDDAAESYGEHCDSGNSIRQVLETFDPATGKAQALHDTFRSLDSFNWGYDPVHFTVPEGSYASDAHGVARIVEFREMVQSATNLGLNVVLDVVYNHTNASGLAEKSVLDKLVPGYYHRQNPETGVVEQSSCCENTASEHRMMEKLMIDSLVTWASEYSISGFRFDLMGHHMLSNMENALDAVKAVDPDTYFYGEAWNFGEVANNARGVNAIQANMAGTGIGSFNDRLRDAVRGGGPFDEGDFIRANQGFANGLFSIPNDRNSGSDTEKERLLQVSDWIRIGIAGSLSDYSLVTADGSTKTGAEIDYNGQNAGYTSDPQEIINYVSKHDNQTLWDNNQYKADFATTHGERAQMQVIGLSVPILSQGIPFIHMGSELLRSKSMERDSYDSGDWFNEVDFSYQETAWNRGLPRQDKDGANWDLITEVIGQFETGPAASDINYTREQVEELLTVRNQSELFRLQTAEQVSERLDFHNTGTDQVPGVILFSLDDGPDNGLTDLDSDVDQLVVFINSTGSEQTLDTSLDGTFSVMADTSPGESAAATSGTFTVPALSVAVFSR